MTSSADRSMFLRRYCTLVPPRPPSFLVDDSGAEFHADQESYRNVGLKVNSNEVIHLQSSRKS